MLISLLSIWENLTRLWGRTSFLKRPLSFKNLIYRLPFSPSAQGSSFIAQPEPHILRCQIQFHSGLRLHFPHKRLRGLLIIHLNHDITTLILRNQRYPSTPNRVHGPLYARRRNGEVTAWRLEGVVFVDDVVYCAGTVKGNVE